MHVKFEVCSFDRFGAIIATGPLHTDAHTDTSNENSISAIHSVHLAEIIIMTRIKDDIKSNNIIIIIIINLLYNLP